jgi:hypothetical protein
LHSGPSSGIKSTKWNFCIFQKTAGSCCNQQWMAWWQNWGITSHTEAPDDTLFGLCIHMCNQIFEQKMDLQGQSSLPAAHLPGWSRLQEAGANSLYMYTRALAMSQLLLEPCSWQVLP